MVRIIRNTALTLFLCVVFMFFSTNGFSVFTSEGARRHNIQQNPVSLPKIPLLSSSGEEFYIQDLQGKIVLVDFIFTSCSGICPMMTKNFKVLQNELQNSSLKEQVILLTVSFDPERDTQQRLIDYAASIGADSNLWKFAAIPNKKNLEELLAIFGIVVIPASNGQFEHNGAIHLVNQFGKLAKVYDYESIELILNELGATNAT